MTNKVLNVSKEFLRASQHGDLIKLKELTQQFNIKDWTIYRHEVSGDTALHIVAREGHLEVAEYLCNNWKQPQFKVDVTNKDMKRPLHEASQFSRCDIVNFLIKQGYYLSKITKTIFMP